MAARKLITDSEEPTTKVTGFLMERKQYFWTGFPVSFLSSCFVCRCHPSRMVLPGSLQKAFFLQSMVSMVQACVDRATAPPLPRSTGASVYG